MLHNFAPLLLQVTLSPKQVRTNAGYRLNCTPELVAPTQSKNGGDIQGSNPNGASAMYALAVLTHRTLNGDLLRI